MSTAPLRPPTSDVEEPRDAEQVRQYVAEGTQRRRWGRFLAARSALLSLLHRARTATVELVERFRLGGALRAARATLGWASQGARLLRRGIEIIGMASAVGMVIASPTVRNLAARAGAAASRAVRTVASRVASAGRWLLGLFGPPGRSLAAKVATATSTVVSRVRSVVAPIARVVARALDVTSLPVRTLGTLATERALGRLLSAVLPRPWAAVARVVAGVLMLPPVVRQRATMTVLDLLGRFSGASQAPDAAASGDSRAHGTEGQAGVARPMPRSASPNGPRTPVVVEMTEPEWERLHEHLDGQLDLTEGVLPPKAARYPAAKRKSAPRR